MDYEAFRGRALPASLDHQGTRLPLGERAQVLRKAVGLVERHLAAGTPLLMAPLGRCRSLPPLGGRVCASLLARPFFTARHQVMLQLMRLATHCRDTWVRRLWTPARVRPSLGDRFLMDYYPRPSEGGPPRLPYASRPPRRHPWASRSWSRNAAAHRERATAPGARCAWSTGHPRAPGARAWGGASTVAPASATRGTAALRRARGARRQRLGSRRAAKSSSCKTGACDGAVLLARGT